MRRIVLGIAAAMTTFAPAAVQADDQQIADFIRNKLQTEQQQGNLRGFNVDLRVDRGTVWLDGDVSSKDQEALILRTAQGAGYLGVVQVVDDIDVVPPAAEEPVRPVAIEPTIMPGPSARTASLQTPLGSPAGPRPTAQQVQYQQQPPAPAQQYRQQPPAPARYAQLGSGSRNFAQPATDYAAPIVTGEVYGAPVDYGVPADGGYVVGGEPMPFASAGGCPGGACGVPVEGVPVGGGQPVAYGGGQPLAAGYGGGGPGAGGPSEAPNLPGYAWPGYAANPNYGALTYPKQYSASAWPYIGPFYPYPQVPLGWRKVTLEWDDGFWQLDFNDH